MFNIYIFFLAMLERSLPWYLVDSEKQGTEVEARALILLFKLDAFPEERTGVNFGLLKGGGALSKGTLLCLFR